MVTQLYRICLLYTSNYYFTWHDIEDIFEENRSFWPETWIDVQVYSDCVEIYQNSDERCV